MLCCFQGFKVVFSSCTGTNRSRKYQISSFTCFYGFIYFYFFCDPHLLSKNARHAKVFFKSDFMAEVASIDQEHRGEKVCITCHGKNILLFVTPAKESTFVVTHHANEIWQVWSGLESLSQRSFVKPVPSLPTVSHIYQIPLLFSTFRFVGSNSAVTSTEGIDAVIACAT